MKTSSKAPSADMPSAGVPPRPPGKTRRVTRPRKTGVKTIRTVTYLTEKIRLAAEAAAEARKSSLTEIIAGAVARSVKDDIWSPRIRVTVARNKTLTPPPQYVELCNLFVAHGYLLEKMLKGGFRTDELDEASRIFLDCQAKLDALRSELGC